MNSFISHRLLVAAVGNESHLQAKPARGQTRFGNVEGIASAIPLELLDPGKPIPGSGARPLRTSNSGQRSKS